MQFNPILALTAAEVSMPIWWLILALLCLILEMSTAILISVWFVIGAFAALITSLLTPNVIVQAIVFVAVSLLSLFIMWKKRAVILMQHRKTPTNADTLIGQQGVVTEEINPLNATGRISIHQQDWRAASATNTFIALHSPVIVKSISGVKLMVEPIQPANQNTDVQSSEKQKGV